jgi:hypothetical protein
VSNVNEPEEALKLAASMVKDLIRSNELMRAGMMQQAEVQGRTIALVDMLLGQVEDGAVVLTDPTNGTETSARDHVDDLRQMLLSQREVNEAVVEQLGGAQMLYDRFLARYTTTEDDE